MKHIGKYIIALGIVTVCMLLYVHQHIAILLCSYTINQKEDTLTELNDIHKNLKFQLASLKSPTALEQKLAAADINLVLPKEINVLKIPVTHTEPILVVKDQIPTHKSNILKFFGFEKEAQAELPKHE